MSGLVFEALTVVRIRGEPPIGLKTVETTKIHI